MAEQEDLDSGVYRCSSATPSAQYEIRRIEVAVTRWMGNATTTRVVPAS